MTAIERRFHDRQKVENVWVQEQNGEFIYSLQAVELSEEGIFLRGRFLTLRQKPISKLAIRLSNGDEVRNIIARPIREEINGRRGIAYKFINMDEDAKLRIRFFLTNRSFDEKGTATLFLVANNASTEQAID